MSEQQSAERIAALFAGHSKASGTHGMPEQDGAKWSIKKTARTLKSGPTLALWDKHIRGERPLGVVPICEDGTCKWGSIDVDEYDIDLLELVAQVEALKLPLVSCRSKSGGLHLFLFASEPVQAELMQSALRSAAAALGHGDAEIFPKQTSVGNGSSGNWMVMPYFGGTFGGKLQFQYGLKKTGAEMTLGEFLTAAEKRKVSAAQLAEMRQSNAETTKQSRRKGRRAAKSSTTLDPNGPFGNGPPCLQVMAESGFPEGGRNNALFHMGVFRRKANPDNWKEALSADNQNYMRPPLPAAEVVQVQKQLEKQSYEYLCRHAPMANHCDTIECQLREYGVGDDLFLPFPVIIEIKKIKLEQPVYHLRLEGHEDQLMTIEKYGDLHWYNKFIEHCGAQLNMVCRPAQQWVWQKALAVYMTKIVEVQPSEDTTKFGHFRELLETFLTNRSKGERREDILRGAPWHDEESGRHYFRLEDLQRSLTRDGLRESRNQVTDWIRRLGGPETAAVTTIKRKSVRLWHVPSDAVQDAPELDAPAIRPDEL